MTDQTAPIASQNGLQIPTGDELYDMLMKSIEPDLTTDHLPLLSGLEEAMNL